MIDESPKGVDVAVNPKVIEVAVEPLGERPVLVWYRFVPMVSTPVADGCNGSSTTSTSGLARYMPGATSPRFQ